MNRIHRHARNVGAKASSSVSLWLFQTSNTDTDLHTHWPGGQTCLPAQRDIRLHYKHLCPMLYRFETRTGCEPYLYPFSKRYIPNTELSAPKRQAGLHNTKFSALFFITWIRPVLNLFATLEWHLSAFEAGVIQATLCQRLTKQHLQITVEYFWIHFKNKNDVELIELYRLF